MSFVLSVGYSAILSSGDLFPLLTDGDLLSYTVGILALRGRDTVRVAKVRGQATGDMVRNGRVRREDKIGNEAADAAAELGRRHQLEQTLGET